MCHCVFSSTVPVCGMCMMSLALFPVECVYLTFYGNPHVLVHAGQVVVCCATRK